MKAVTLNIQHSAHRRAVVREVLSLSMRVGTGSGIDRATQSKLAGQFKSAQARIRKIAKSDDRALGWLSLNIDHWVMDDAMNCRYIGPHGKIMLRMIRLLAGLTFDREHAQLFEIEE